MAQNIYDTPDFFRGYSQLPRSIHGLDGAPEWPAIRALLPDLNGKRIVDLGCGALGDRWLQNHRSLPQFAESHGMQDKRAAGR